LLLDRPKLLLLLMMFYFLLMPNNRLLGLLGLPLPGFIDELFFLPLIAVIVMNWIQRRQLKQATLFPIAFCLIAALSWYVNGKPSLFTALQVTLIMLKSYILWYFCRLTCTFENDKQLARWYWAYVSYVAIQFLYNMLWQQGPWPRFNPDFSGGVFGPDSTSAHMVGYISVFALLLLVGWWVSARQKASSRVRRRAIFLAVIITYNPIFMTDTKHALVLFPLVFLPFLLHPSFSARMRVNLLSLGAVFMLATVGYFHLNKENTRVNQVIKSFKNSPKGDMFYAVTVDFGHLVPYPLLGAGPGRFASNQARDARVPLARRYILPYYDEARRLGYYGRRGSTVVSSVIGAVNTDFFVLMGEFGWLGTCVFYGFIIWVVVQVFRKSREWVPTSLESGLFLGLACCLIFLMLIMMLTSASTVPVVVFPIWMMIGRMWDMRQDTDKNRLPAE